MAAKRGKKMAEQDNREVNQQAITGQVFETKSSDAYSIAQVLTEVHRLTGVPRTALAEAQYESQPQLSGNATTVFADPKLVTGNAYSLVDVTDQTNVSHMTSFIRRRSAQRKAQRAA